jgi:GNAT superfamily N-acetyltransferase
MELEIRAFTKDRIPDVLDFESRLRKEEDFWGWEINQAYVSAVERSFDDRSFRDCVSLLAYDGGTVVGRIDASLIASRFDGSKKAYLDWICVIKSSRHQGVAQRLLESLRQILKDRQIDTLIALTAANEEAQRFYKSVPDSVMRDVGIWIDIK